MINLTLVESITYEIAWFEYCFRKWWQEQPTIDYSI